MINTEYYFFIVLTTLCFALIAVYTKTILSLEHRWFSYSYDYLLKNSACNNCIADCVLLFPCGYTCGNDAEEELLPGGGGGGGGGANCCRTNTIIEYKHNLFVYYAIYIIERTIIG